MVAAVTGGFFSLSWPHFFRREKSQRGWKACIEVLLFYKAVCNIDASDKHSMALRERCKQSGGTIIRESHATGIFFCVSGHTIYTRADIASSSLLVHLLMHI